MDRPVLNADEAELRDLLVYRDLLWHLGVVRRKDNPKPVRPLSEPLEAKPTRLADFGDAESQRVLTAAARAVARELGREAAREHFAKLIGRSRAPE